MSAPKVVIVGAGIVGCSLADELTARGWTDVTVLDQGPLPAPGGSTSHAPGLVFRTSPSRTLAELAKYTVEKFAALEVEGRPCFNPVGGLELATTPERLAELERRAGFAASWGVEGELVSPERCHRMWPLLDRERVLGGWYTPGDGLARAVPACRAQIDRARAAGARFLDRTTVTGVGRSGGKVTGVTTDRGEFPADVVVSAAGFWGPVLGRMAGVEVPLLPLAHQYARSTPLPELRGVNSPFQEASKPILRHQDRDLYFREHTDALGIGSYAHRPMPVDPFTVPPFDEAPVMPSSYAFTPEDFEESWRESQALLPALRGAAVADGFNGVFSFTPDGMPLLGEAPGLRGFWLAEAVWVTHSAGVGRAVAEWMVDGKPQLDLHECELSRFEGGRLSPSYVRERSAQNFTEVYDIIHPLQPSTKGRGLRTSPFHQRQQELGAVFLESEGWERPHWYQANAGLAKDLDLPDRDAWSAAHWSPIAAAEALATRERVAMYDMTPLRRLAATGPGALDFLQHMTSNNLARKPGSVSYTLLLDETGGIRSDLTVARLGEQHFQIGANTPADLEWLRRHAPADRSVELRDITAGTCCVGVWGPLTRDLVQPLTDADFGHRALGYFKAGRAFIGDVPVTALRVSYVGELGWELYTSADLGLRLWDTLWRAGEPYGVVAAGRSAFNSLRLEKGYRAWGADMTAEHDPYQAGVGFAVRMDKGDFLGRAALLKKPGTPSTRLTALTLDDPSAVVLGSEPVHLGDGRAAHGYVTSAGYGYTLGRCVAYAWLPPLDPGSPVTIGYFGERLPATVAEEPLFDPKMTRIRR
jgi:glycine cleavage system aminomethyltransferase T/glycine/D-amino acid oxidase-like deaminating enzyme